MASTINASTTSTSGLVQTADASGVLQLQSNGVTGLTIDTGGKVILPSLALGTATAGELEYDGGELYFTPLGTQRGLVPSAQYYRLNSTVVGANATGAQNTFGVGCTLSSSTVYQFEGVFVLSKTAGTTSHTISFGFGGTATVTNIGYMAVHQAGNSQSEVPYAGAQFTKWIVTSSLDVVTTGITAATTYRWVTLSGTVSVNAGGTFIPQYSLSAAPGGAYTTQAGGYFSIYPLGSAGSNISIGTWA